MSNNGSVDQSGLIDNVLTDGLQLDFITSIKEFIDNSIDAKSTKIHLIIQNNYIIIVDNGYGMNKQRLENFITLCKKNDNNENIGYYGLGAKAALCNISKKYSGKLSKIFTKTNDGDETQIIIDWEMIRNNLTNKNVWSDNIRYQDISKREYKNWENIKISDTGTIIMIDYDNKFEDYIIDQIKEILHDIKKTYYYTFLNTDIEIKINDEFCNKYNSLDFLHYNKIKETSGDCDYINLKTISANYREKIEIYAKVIIQKNDNNYKIHFVESNLINIEGSIYYYISKKCKELVSETNIEFNNTNEFEYYICWVDKETLDQDTKLLTEATGGSNAALSAGLYFVRNNRNLSKPISLERCRTTQTHTKWRAAMIFNNDNTFTNLVKLGINKSIIKKENLDKNLYKMLSLVTKIIIDPCVMFMSNKKCYNCNKINKECCCGDKCNYCNRFQRECDCCYICNRLQENCDC